MTFKKIDTYNPRLNVLNQEQIWSIHAAALEILAKTGFEMRHRGAKKMLLDSGCSLSRNGRIRMPAYLAEEALNSAPGRIQLYDQSGNTAMDLVDENWFYGTGSDTIFTLDINNGQRRRTTIEDTVNFARMVDALANMDFAMSMSNPEDVPIDDIYVYVFAEMIKNTNKPLIFIADRGEDIAKMYDIACLIAGGEKELQEKPFLLNYSEAISPLIFPENVIEKLVFCAQKKIPICLPSGCNAGGGGPVTLAGALALGIAENLVGLVVHQLAGKGSPFLFAPNVSVLDMQTSVISYGCPEWSLTQAALADMRDEIYGLPIWAFAGASDSKVMDAQAGAEAMFSILTAMQSRCNVIHDVGYLEFGTTSSLEMLVMADELVAMSRHFTAGIPVNAETLALDVIDQVALGGEQSIFLTEDHTLDHFKQAHFHPRLLNRAQYDGWDAQGAADLYARCNAEAKKILADPDVKPKPAGIVDEIEDILEPPRKRMAV
ncbi:MAG: trimethylamine methyltransferase family protein [Desulfobacterales bacterium]|jgi:trimethylamine--corrinoid protein Co-methyltransferase